jgi:hypothetical protein
VDFDIESGWFGYSAMSLNDFRGPVSAFNIGFRRADVIGNAYLAVDVRPIAPVSSGSPSLCYHMWMHSDGMLHS